MEPETLRYLIGWALITLGWGFLGAFVVSRMGPRSWRVRKRKG